MAEETTYEVGETYWVNVNDGNSVEGTYRGEGTFQTFEKGRRAKAQGYQFDIDGDRCWFKVDEVTITEVGCEGCEG